MSARLLVLVVLSATVVVASNGCGGRVAPAAFAQFQRAQEAFDQARQPDDFLRVAAQYQEILDSGLISGAVLYNQGNAFMRAGEHGRAIASYRQAKRYRPRDPYLRANLAYALGDVAAEAPRKPLVEYILFWQDWLSYPEKILIDTLAGGLTFLLALAGFFWRPRLMNRLALGAFFLTLVWGLSAAYDWYRFDLTSRGVVIKDGVIARKGDAESYAPALTRPLRAGSEFRLLEERGDWILVELSGGQQGWIRAGGVVIY